MKKRAEKIGRTEMLQLKNDVSSLKELFEKKQHVVLYGAGASTKLLLQSHGDMFPERSLQFIVDGNDKMDGTYCVVGQDLRIKVLSLKHFCEIWGEGEIKRFTLLMTPYYSLHFIRQLDQIAALDGVEAYVYSFIAEKASVGEFSLRETKEPRIPKIIHYFWIGDAEMPEEDKRNIASWRKFCPDYEIIEWNESNYDFSKYRYVQEALEKKQYMYATDAPRKDVLYRYGGIYLDTDVELLRPLDDLLYHEAFIGIDDGGQVNSGSGLGAAKHNALIKDMLDLYEDVSFVKEDGSYNSYYNTFYETKYLIENGFKIGNRYQKIGTMDCLPREVLMPEGVIGLHDNYTEKTIARHKINPYDKSLIAPVRERLYADAQER